MNVEPTAIESWRDLFAPAHTGHPGVSLVFYALRRHGEPFLLLPTDRRLAARALDLYPAQRWPARCAKSLLRAAFGQPVPLPLRRVRLTVDPADDVLQLCQQVGGNRSLAILAGNPHATGRRFIILVFNAAGAPVAVVKTGLSASARQLIARERSFLAAVPLTAPGIPRLARTFESARLEALVLPYLPGRPPRLAEYGQAGVLLSSWLDRTRTIPIGELLAWQRLQAAAAGDPVLDKLAPRLMNQRIHPAIYHGDFAPWNVKVSSADDRWTALDWERGELTGPAGWDWLHFWLQPAVLVERCRAAGLAARIEAVVASAEFNAYVQAAGLGAVKYEWTLAYLLYWLNVLGAGRYEAVGRPAVEILEKKWRGD